MRFLFIFIDGIGLGEYNPAINPFVRYQTPFFLKNFGQPLSAAIGIFLSPKLCMVPLDATMGVEGLPQSATGQTALFTGINAAKNVGHHVHAFPGPQLTAIISEHGIMKKVLDAGLNATSANMYSPDYLDLVRLRKRRNSVSTLLILGAGLPLRSLPEMRAGKAVYQDITNEMLPLFGINNVETVTPAIAGKRLIEIAKENHFTLFEYFQTDRCGHKQNWETAEKIIWTIDEFLSEIQGNLPEDMLAIITSDHGNFEDFSVKTHTLNPVPFIVLGKGCKQAAQKTTSLTDVTPVILSVLKGWKDCD